ncbi:hypothetical protein ENSA5_23780 [Enhygromyxa salina]|uniref:PEGA domain-containing protein n=1 Tax=Enhygromyxa salina TaxID=215803 RepID=A0A2S9YBH1_9BACT|nr:hypothetical protein [Enhygromyxa salina]PRQ02361.1 hypothetical protein ENSA5_23780 [Enhygromyxa salina]
MMTASILLLSLILTTSAPQPESPYAIAVNNLTKADAALSVDPERKSDELLTALTNLTLFPASVASDPETQALQSLAQLNLARSYLLADRPELASAVIDEAIRTAHGQELAAAVMGPTLEDLYHERLAALELAGRARLRVRCSIPCRVYVDERETPLLSGPLYLGPYRVWVTDASGVRPPLREPVMLRSAGEVVEIHYQPPAPRPYGGVDRSPPEQREMRRMLPRGAEIAMVALGVGLAGVGGWLLSGRDFDIEGAAVIGAGGLSFTIGGVLLIVDENRVARGGASPARSRSGLRSRTQ